MGTEGLPGWLGARGTRLPAAREGKAAYIDFAERTLGAGVRFVENTFFNDALAARAGFLQKTEPRIKILILLALVVALSFEREAVRTAPYILFALLMAALSRIPFFAYLKRALPAFMFTAVIALPASLNLIVPGEPFFILVRWEEGARFLGLSLPDTLHVTRQGMESALTLLFRVTASVMLVFLAGFTTRPAVLLKALSSILPGFLGTVVSVSYRYIFFLVKKMEEFVLARKARGAGRVQSGRRWAGSRAASLLLISIKLKEDLEMAMEARGMVYKTAGEMGRVRPGLYDAALVFLALLTVLI